MGCRSRLIIADLGAKSNRAKLGAFSRSDALTPDDFEMLAVAVKS